MFSSHQAADYANLETFSLEPGLAQVSGKKKATTNGRFQAKKRSTRKRNSATGIKGISHRSRRKWAW